ncbi:MAG: GerAB/ArcD/ProY family transporter [Bacilli bacterium]
MITKRQYQICSFFLSRFLFFGAGLSFLFLKSNNDTWIACILGFILGLVAFKLLHIANKRNSKQDICDLIKNNIVMKIIVYLFCFLLLNYLLTVLTIMNHSFFLFETPPLFIAILFMIVIIYGVRKGETVFAKVAEFLFFISIVVFIFKLFGYGSYALNYYDNIFPIFNTRINNFLMSTLIFFIYSFFPNILLLSFKDMHLTYKDMIIGYIIGAISIILTILIISMTFGFPLTTIIRFPEYMVLKKISLFDVFKNMENILVITWYFDCIVSGFIITNIIKKLNNNTFHPIIKKGTYILLLILSLLIAVNIFVKDYTKTILLYRYSYIVIGILGFAIILYLLVRKKGN